jgi:hypothetical protein
MWNRCLAIVTLIALVAAPLRAELQYTIRIVARPSTVAPVAPPNPLMAMIGGLVVSTIAPEGGLELTITTGDKGTRVDYPKAYFTIPAGGATIVRPDGSMVVLDLARHTYWMTTKPDLSSISGGGTPAVTIRKTGEFATVAGARSEHSTVEIRLSLPAQLGTPLLEGIPSEIRLVGDIWIAAQYKAFSALSAGLLGGLESLGLDALNRDGLMMRSLLRGDLFGTQEIESVVTAIRETPAPASAFAIPPGFTEIPPP